MQRSCYINASSTSFRELLTGVTDMNEECDTAVAEELKFETTSHFQLWLLAYGRTGFY